MLNGTTLEVPLKDMATKVCSKCKVTKALDSFHRNSRMGDGLQTACKQCAADYNRDRQKRIKARRYYQTKKGAPVLEGPIKSQQELKIVLNDSVAYLRFEGPLSDGDFNIVLRSIGLHERELTGKR